MDSIRRHGSAPRSFLPIIALLAQVLLAGSGIANEIPELEALKEDYASRLNAGLGPYQTAVDDLKAKYVARLKREQGTSQAAGKLDDAVKLDNEVKKISGGGDVPPEDEKDAPPVIKKMRATFRSETAKLEGLKDKNVKPLRDDYAKKLDALVTNLTKEGKLDDAMYVKSFRENQFSETSAASAVPSGKTMSISLPNGVQMMFCFCPPGAFKMGSPPDDEGRGRWEDEAEVQITRGFWIAQTECTQKQWTAVMGSNPSVYQKEDCPVEGVSWNDANGFVKKLNEGNVLPKGMKATLPTEAQWEYACRAGTKTPYSFGKKLRPSEALFDPAKEAHEAPVASYRPNAWGLYDMHGNVNELCSNWHADKNQGGADPKGPSGGEFISYRGGGWSNSVGSSRSAARGVLHPYEKCPNVGFRIVCNVE